MKNKESRRDQVIKALNDFTKKNKLTFDLDGRSFRKLPKKDVWSVHLRSSEGSPLFQEVFVERNFSTFKIGRELKKLFPVATLEGGGGNWSMFIKVGWLEEYEYKPYIGGAGPDASQVMNNDLYLQQELKKLGIECEYKNHTYDYMDPFKVLHFTSRRKVPFTVSYDRWGYCGEGHSFLNEMDQVSNPQEVIDTIIKLVKG